MRFVIAIAAFVLAAVTIGVGVAQRTIWAPAADVTASAQVSSDAPYIVLSGSTLNAIDGQQTLDVSGSADPFVAYGRTADVMAWVGDEPYTRLTYDAATKSLKAGLHQGGASSGDGASTPTSTATPGATATATPGATSTPAATQAAAQTSGTTATANEVASISPTAPNPAGSDLWLEQFTGKKAETTTMNVPDGVSVIIASDGAHAAPSDISLTWPMDTRTPWAGPLIVLGSLLAVAGIVFYILAIRHMRRGRGPRRGGSNGRGPRLSRAERRELAAASAGGADVRGRRALGRGMIAVPVVLAGALTLAGCSSDYWPQIGASSASPTPTATPLTTQLPGQGADHPAPAVTEPQLRNIVERIAETAKTADSTRNAALAATRFTGAALTERQLNYRIRASKPGYALPTAVPVDQKLYPILPQATDTWPRVVNVVVQDAAAKIPTYYDLTLTQQSPRENYKVAYLVSMTGGQIPDLAPASIGTTLVPPDSKLLAVQPSQLATEYASVLKLGAKSPYYSKFAEDVKKKDDTLANGSDGTGTDGAGAAAEAQQRADIKAKNELLDLTYLDSAGSTAPIALATNDAGALVSTTVLQKQVYKLLNSAAKFNPLPPSSPTSAFIDVTKAANGVESDYSYQLLFYVPPVESNEQIRLLGWSQAMVGAKQLP
ncbi:MAG: hypothetical protein FWD85_08310 [Microbacteriaceae bacterium]|nr:hypothetical protein [Microbacteriaceae bacterium]MCL2795294.1 hypothetical protein [Microbacteriaceae bacterium]